MRRLLFIKQILAGIAFSAVVLLQSAIAVTAAEQMPAVPVPGMVTMVELGAKKCIPCKMMAPIIAELEKEYKDRVAVVFIDVWEKPDAGREFGIRTIPTQIFYDASGKEVLRHEGYFDKASIVAELQKLGVR